MLALQVTRKILRKYVDGKGRIHSKKVTGAGKMEKVQSCHGLH